MGGGHSQGLSDTAKQPKLGWDCTAEIIGAETAVTHTACKGRPSAGGRAPSDRGQDYGGLAGEEWTEGTHNVWVMLHSSPSSDGTVPLR